MRLRTVRWVFLVLSLLLGIEVFMVIAAGGSTVQHTAHSAPIPVTAQARADGPIGSEGFRGVLVQRTTDFQTSFSNDSIPAFDVQRYDTDGAWSPMAPDRLTIPSSWDGQAAIFQARGAWSGHTGDYVELKLYCGAVRPIQNQEEHLIAVVQDATNIASPFVELTTAPIVVHAGEQCFIAFKTPAERTLIAYGNVTTLFGAYLPAAGLPTS